VRAEAISHSHGSELNYYYFSLTLRKQGGPCGKADVRVFIIEKIVLNRFSRLPGCAADVAALLHRLAQRQLRIKLFSGCLQKLPNLKLPNIKTSKPETIVNEFYRKL